ncbi:lipocalin-like domain-containing protein [Kitasatospora sp. NPDC127116]|uniref:lipocalin-like domain-containing protein n=1 Tax=Kitasatospora sp. NPDC127116 TaxID=3345367 RepID=UPI003638E75D
MVSTRKGIDVRQVMGAWQLVSFTATDAHGEVTHPFGTEVRGLIIYTPDGHMSAHVAGEDGYLGYAGTFEWLGDRVVHRTVVGSEPRWTEAHLLRTAHLAAGRLTLRSLPDDNGQILGTVWQRMPLGPATEAER